jgi:hypothetical protein
MPWYFSGTSFICLLHMPWYCSGTNFIATVFLFVFNGLDNVGRRSLLLVGATGMAASLAVTGVIFLTTCPTGTCDDLAEALKYTILIGLCGFILR